MSLLSRVERGNRSCGSAVQNRVRLWVAITLLRYLDGPEVPSLET
jgi:hypothetical protein